MQNDYFCSSFINMDSHSNNHTFSEEIDGRPILIITAPSGAGKTSITNHLLAKFPQLAFSISAATRSPRAGEENGKHYYFISVEEFREKIRKEEFIEWEMVYEGKYYGTLKTELFRIWNNRQAPILDIDVKGAIHVQQQNPSGSLSIFIQPPSIEELRRRLESRGTETKEAIEARVNKAAYEISFKDNFDEIIVNQDLDKAKAEAEKLVKVFLIKHRLLNISEKQ